MNKNNNLAGQPVLCQLLSFLPKDIVDECVALHGSDRYYKTMTTYRQLVFLLYGVVSKSQSLNSLCKNLLFLENRLTYLGITHLPAASTLSDANIHRDSNVFASIYQRLCQYYSRELSSPDSWALEEKLDTSKVSILDSSTIGLFVDLFKGAGRNSLSGKKKGGLKVHAKLPLDSGVPDLVHLTEAASNDRNFLGQLQPAPGEINVFDKGFVNYSKWAEYTQNGAFFVTRLNENASYQVLSGQPNHISEYADGGVVSDRIILLDPIGTQLKARLVVYKDPESGNVLKFVSNMFDYQALTIVQLYKYRWNIEVIFKRLKQNFELGYFFSDSQEGIKTQIWIALIANLLFTVIHKRCKEAELFATLVNLAATNMGSYVSLVKVVLARRLSRTERDLEKMQMEIWPNKEGGVSERQNNPP